jgi:hypothetical protein
MEATILLCDAAEAVNGKLYILGGGWSVTGPAPAPSALAIKIDVPWTEANRKIPLVVQLVTADGLPMTVRDPLQNEQAVKLELEIEVGRPPGVVPGAPLDATVAFGIPPLPLPPGQRFQWRVSIDNETKPHWNVAFSTRQAPAG